MCKVERIIQKYNLSDLDSEIRRQHRNGNSLRSLETLINKRVLERALMDAEVALIGDTESIYQVLTQNDSAPGRKTEIRSQLERAGPPASDVEEDFISHQTVKRHLQNCLGIDTKRQAQITLDDAEDTIEWSQSRNRSVIENTLTRLHKAGLIEAGHLDVTQSVRVTCENTGNTFHLREFLKRGGCDCHSSSDDAP
ncbi:rod-determining factor RdfA [Saliphagus infecundisoli]|uniref:Rod-determining factor RdfA n=1 Tax=Saliphagus infecundisoli TaxID=1849069 RepID=A0ABD5QC82_9EURY